MTDTASSDLLTIAQELAAVTRLIEDDDLTTSLGRFAKRVVATVDGCDHASIHCLDSQTQACTLASAGAEGLALFDGAPHALADFGPVAETLAFGEPRRMDDVEIEQRWPVYIRQMTDAGFRSCLVLPIPSERPEHRAAFLLMSQTVSRFSDIALDMALLFTLNAGVIFENASLYNDSRKLVGQLQTAIATQRLIGQAQGLVARSAGVDTQRAFELLTKASQNTNTKLREVSRALVAAHDAGDIHPELSRFGLG